MEPGALTATQLSVEPEVVQRSGEHCSNVAPEIDMQVHRRLQVAGESVTPAEWTGVAREPFNSLHTRLTQQSGALAEKVAALGLTLTQSAMGYLKADDLGVRLMSGQPTPGGDWTLLDDNLVTGPRTQLTRAQVQANLQTDSRVIRREVLQGEQLTAVNDAERYQVASQEAREAGPASMRGKCWAVDETQADPIVDEYGPIPSGFKDPRPPYEQYSMQVKDYADTKLGPEGKLGSYSYRLRENSSMDYYEIKNPDGTKTRVDVPGLEKASHAEKQASMRGIASKRIGINKFQCQDCKAYFQATAFERGVPQYVADPEVTRIYYPNGEVGLVVKQDGQRVVYVFSRDTAYNAYNGSGAAIP